MPRAINNKTAPMHKNLTKLLKEFLMSSNSKILALLHGYKQICNAYIHFL